MRERTAASGNLYRQISAEKRPDAVEANVFRKKGWVDGKTFKKECDAGRNQKSGQKQQIEDGKHEEFDPKTLLILFR